MALTRELADAERRLAAMINSRADSEETERLAAKRDRIRADDARCQSLQAEFQEDFRQFGAEPPMPRADEWSGQYEKRLLRGLQRRLSPSSDLADPSLLDVPAPALGNFAQMIRSEAASEAKRPSFDNLPETLDDPRAKLETINPDTGERRIEWRAKRSFIADMSMAPKTVVRIVDPRTQNVLFGAPFDKMPKAR
jgi:hypothetical protein